MSVSLKFVKNNSADYLQRSWRTLRQASAGGDGDEKRMRVVGSKPISLTAHVPHGQVCTTTEQ